MPAAHGPLRARASAGMAERTHPRRAATDVWFVTRKYPPSIGGMELLSWELTTRIARRRPVKIFSLRRGSRWLPLFVLTSAARVLAAALNGSIAVLHLGDPVLAPVGALAHLFRVPVCVTVHGLDVTYPNPLYQLWLRAFFRQIDAYVCISSAARDAAVARGVAKDRTTVIGVGLTVPEATYPAPPRDPDLLLFVGRLVRRKGLGWFVGSVLPMLIVRNPRVRLAIIGTGPERDAIEAAAAKCGVGDRLVWLGLASDADKWRWLRTASVCVMPNVQVPGDIEGYGISALEAAAAGCPLVAANLEGLRDAIGDGEGGRLVASADAVQWADAVHSLLAQPAVARAFGDRARDWVRTNRNWDAVCDRYEEVFAMIARRHSR